MVLISSVVFRSEKQGILQIVDLYSGPLRWSIGWNDKSAVLYKSTGRMHQGPLEVVNNPGDVHFEFAHKLGDKLPQDLFRIILFCGAHYTIYWKNNAVTIDGKFDGY